MNPSPSESPPATTPARRIPLWAIILSAAALLAGAGWLLLPRSGRPMANQPSAPAASRPFTAKLDHVRTELPSVERMLLMPGGRLALALGGDRAVQYNRWGIKPFVLTVLDPATGKTLKQARVEGPTLRGASAASDGRHVLLWGDQEAPGERRMSPAPFLALWDLHEGREVIRFGKDLDLVVRSAALARDGSLALTGQDSRPLRLWDVTTGEVIKSIRTDVSVGCLAISEDAKQALVGGDWGDEAVHLWDLQKECEIQRFSGHRGPVTSVQFSPDGKLIASTSLDGTARVWDIASGRELRRFSHGETAVFQAVFSPDRLRLLTIECAPLMWGQLYMQYVPGNALRLWDVCGGAELGRYSSSAQAAGAAFTSDGLAVTWGGASGTLDRLTLSPPDDAGPALARLDAAQPPPQTSHQTHCLATSDVYTAGFFADGQAFSAGQHKNTVFRWDIDTGKQTGALTTDRVLQWPSPRAISPAGNCAVSLQSPMNNEAFLWDLPSGKVIAHPIPTGNVSAAAISRDGQVVALGCGIRDAQYRDVAWEIWLLNAQDGSEIARLSTGLRRPMFLAFSPDGRTLAASGPELSLWDVKARQPLRTRISQHAGFAGVKAVWSADGKRLMAVHPGGVRVWDVEKDQLAGELDAPGRIQCADLSPDGRRILTGGFDTNVRLFDLASKKQLAIFTEHLYPVNAVAFAPDARRAISGSHDNTLRVWRLPEEAQHE